MRTRWNTVLRLLASIALSMSSLSVACHPIDSDSAEPTSEGDYIDLGFDIRNEGEVYPDSHEDRGEAEDLSEEGDESLDVTIDGSVDESVDVLVDLPADVPEEVIEDIHEDECSSGCDSGSFNFFVISLEAIQDEGGPEGLGGNLGGLAGADALCQSAANAVGACDKTWVAFLSVTDDGTGSPVHAIDRIGTGPWYDVNGLLLANDIAGLLHDRPDGDDETVVWNDGWRDWVFTDCLTTELGDCNHIYGDSHDILTGSNAQGRLYSSDPTYTCNDWTSTTNNRNCDGTRGECFPAIGHSWPARSGQGWIYSHLAGGCQANINLRDNFESGVGGHGGYGAFYCFGL